MLKRILLLIGSWVLMGLNLFPCTTAVISGKVTPDGRPLLWKHRDTSHHNNRLVYFQDGKYSYVGLVNSEDKKGSQVWIGVNSAGFAIMNSASYNLKNKKDKSKLKDQEGVVMKKALMICAELEDFEKMLSSMKKPLGVEANFGVIDAKGGAAFYETNNTTYTKYDVNDPKACPQGFMVRTNYSGAGYQDEGYGYIRHLTAYSLLYQAVGINSLTPAHIFKRVSRSMKHSLTGQDLNSIGEQRFVFFEDYIPRHSSTSSVVIQGVKKDKNPELSIMWTVLGFPLCSIAFPVWVGEPPDLLRDDGSKKAPLCNLALELKKRCFPIKRGSGKRYLDLQTLKDLLQKIGPLEDRVFKKSLPWIKKWRKNGLDWDQVQNLYGELELLVLDNFPRF